MYMWYQRLSATSCHPRLQVSRSTGRCSIIFNLELLLPIACIPQNEVFDFACRIDFNFPDFLCTPLTISPKERNHLRLYMMYEFCVGRDVFEKAYNV